MGRNHNGTFKVEEVLNLQDVVEYVDGKLFWKIKPHVRYNIGDEVGSLSKNGYKYFSYKNKRYLNHRVTWSIHHGVCPRLIDHIDGDKTNCSIDNLRVSNKILNGMNRDKNKNNTSGLKGVCFDKSRNKWVGQIKIGPKRLSKRFKTKEEASNWYLEMFENLVDFKIYSLKEIEQELAK